MIDRHWNMLADRINQEYAARSKQLAEGYAASIEDYRERVGYLRCMTDIIAWAEEIIASMDVRPPQARVR